MTRAQFQEGTTSEFGGCIGRIVRLKSLRQTHARRQTDASHAECKVRIDGEGRDRGAPAKESG